MIGLTFHTLEVSVQGSGLVSNMLKQYHKQHHYQHPPHQQWYRGNQRLDNKTLKARSVVYSGLGMIPHNVFVFGTTLF